MRGKDLFFLVLLLAVLITGFVVAVDYPPRARFFPLIVISLCGIIVLGELLKAFLAYRKAGGTGIDRPATAEAPERDQKQQRNIDLLAWIGGFALLIWLLGFIIGMPLFMLAYVKLKGEGWRWAIALSATMFVIVYGGFNLLLNIPLYEGLLFLP